MNKETIGRSFKETFAKPVKLVKENPETTFWLIAGELNLIGAGFGFTSGGIILPIVNTVVGSAFNIAVGRRVVGEIMSARRDKKFFRDHLKIIPSKTR